MLDDVSEVLEDISGTLEAISEVLEANKVASKAIRSINLNLLYRRLQAEK
jgi:hypothetical protein